MTRWSLRARLFVLIVPALVAVACLASIARYVLAERMSQRLYDNTLLTVALTISRDVTLSDGDLLASQLLDALTAALGDPVQYRVTGPDGRFVTGYSDPPPRPDRVQALPGAPVFYDAVAQGRKVRAVTLSEYLSETRFSGWVTVDVWQTVHQRDALSLQLLLQAVALMAAVVTAAALLVWFGINLGLRPLVHLRDAVALRSPDDLGPIRRPVPREAESLVAAMNALFVRLSEAFALRDAFISDAAHQLRNPIAAIQAEAEAATTAPDEAALRARVTALADTARRTGRLTGQLLSMEKARGRVAADTRAPVDLVELVGARARRFAEGVLKRGVAVSFSVTGDPRPALADAVMLGEAVDNLLDNARRYGCPGGGEIEIEVTFADARAVIRVSDSGPGIPEAAHARVFDRFYRLGDDASGGCGLGLSIVQKVAEAHGGGARVAPRGPGFSIEVTLPTVPPG